MRGAPPLTGPSRIKGRHSLTRRLRALLLACHRFGSHRASTDDDRAFAYRLFDGLKQTLDAIDREDRP